MENYSEKILEQSQSAVERDEIQNKIVSKLTLVRNNCLVSNIASPINKMFMTLIYFKNSQYQNNCLKVSK